MTDAPAHPATVGQRPVVLLVASPGGHLSQLKQISPCFASYERVWVAFEHPSIDVGHDELVLAYGPTTRNLVNLVRNLVVAWRVVRKHRPDLIVSTGAALAVPFFLMGRLRGVRTMFLEVYDRIDSATLTGKLVRPLADEFLVQWPEQREIYGRGTVVGAVY